jgi:HEAT repeat protein
MNLFEKPKIKESDIELMKMNGNVEGLIAALAVQNKPEIRLAAITDLGKFNDDRALDILVNSLNSDSDFLIRKKAAMLLGEKIDSPKAGAALTHSEIYETNKEVKNEAISGLRKRIAPKYRKPDLEENKRSGSIEKLLQAAANVYHSDVREEAFRILDSLGEQADVKQGLIRLLPTIRDQEYSVFEEIPVIQNIINILSRHCSGTEYEVIDALCRVLFDTYYEWEQRWTVAYQLTRITWRDGGTYIVDKLITALRSETNADFKAWLVDALGFLKSSQAVDTLVDLTKDTVFSQEAQITVQDCAIRALGDIGDEKAVPTLTSIILNNEPPPNITPKGHYLGGHQHSGNMLTHELANGSSG